MNKIKKYKVCKRLGAGVYEKCQTQKFTLASARSFKNKKRRRRMSDYGLQLIDKQRARFMYGVSEKQFSNYAKKALASNVKETKPAMALFQLLEKRLDNVVYRLGLAPTRRMARQLVTHGHFMLNGKKLDVPSAMVKTGDVIAIRPGSQKIGPFMELDKKMKGVKAVNWLTFDLKKVEGKVNGEPTDPDPFVNFQSIVEYYSR